MWNVTGSLCLPYHKRARFCALHVLENKSMTNTVLCTGAGSGGEEGKGISSLGAAGARHHKRKPCLSALLQDASLQQGTCSSLRMALRVSSSVSGTGFVACHMAGGLEEIRLCSRGL